MIQAPSTWLTSITSTIRKSDIEGTVKGSEHQLPTPLANCPRTRPDRERFTSHNNGHFLATNLLLLLLLFRSRRPTDFYVFYPTLLLYDRLAAKWLIMLDTVWMCVAQVFTITEDRSIHAGARHTFGHFSTSIRIETKNIEHTLNWVTYLFENISEKIEKNIQLNNAYLSKPNALVTFACETSHGQMLGF